MNHETAKAFMDSMTAHEIARTVFDQQPIPADVVAALGDIIQTYGDYRVRTSAALSLLHDIADNDRVMAILERYAQPTAVAIAALLGEE